MIWAMLLALRLLLLLARSWVHPYCMVAMTGSSTMPQIRVETFEMAAPPHLLAWSWYRAQRPRPWLLVGTRSELCLCVVPWLQVVVSKGFRTKMQKIKK